MCSNTWPNWRRLGKGEEHPTHPKGHQKHIPKKQQNNAPFWKCHFLTGMCLLSQTAWESQNWGMFHQIRMVFLRLNLPHLPEIRPNCNRKKYILETEPLIFSGKIFGSFSMGISEYHIKIMGYVRSLKGKEVSTTPWYLNQASDTKFLTAMRSFTEGPWEPGVYHSIPVYCVRCMVVVHNILRGIYVDDCRCACIHDDIYLQWYQCRCYIHKYLNPIWNASMIFRVGIVYVQSEGVRQKFCVCQSRPSIRPRNWCN